MTPRTATELARFIDHTLLAPETTRAEVLAACRNAVGWNVAAVCISPAWLPLPVGVMVEGVRVCAVVGFPSGAHTSAIKAAEAAEAVRSGADEIDMVVNLGSVRAADWRAVEADVRSVRAAIDAVAGGRLLKVICESAALSDACRAAVAGGADFVKTSTGFHKAGGATERAVAIMRETVGGHIGVKASGGIRTATAALSMIAAGATRIGASATREILAGMAP
jgi:deoxyribose-phosphate aldolase